MAGINDFVSVFKGGARANLYEVSVTRLSENLKFLAKATALPGKDIGEVALNYLNHTISYRGDITYQDWHVTILMDQDWQLKTQLEEWMEQIQSADDITGAGALTEYAATATVSQLSTQGTPIATYELYNIWPISMPTIELSFDSKDTISEIDVTFKYSHFKRI